MSDNIVARVKNAFNARSLKFGYGEKDLEWKKSDELAFSGTITDPGHLQHQFLPTKIVSGDENFRLRFLTNTGSFR